MQGHSYTQDRVYRWPDAVFSLRSDSDRQFVAPTFELVADRELLEAATKVVNHGLLTVSEPSSLVLNDT